MDWVYLPEYHSHQDFQVNIPNPKEYFKDGTKDMTPAQKEYYYKMMALKAVLQGAIPNIENTFFLAPQITSSVMDKLEWKSWRYNQVNQG